MVLSLHFGIVTIFAAPILSSGFASGSARAAAPQRGDAYKTSGGPRSGVVNVHMIPHTHDDVGWLKTVDQYYSGKNNTIQHAGVKNVLDSVVRALNENSDRTFLYVEQAFFQRWWREQNEKMRILVKRLVSEDRLEMANGGWCMHDEAAPHYMDMIDQTTLGHSFLVREFGVRPKVGWQIDPFGHSATQATLLSAEAGFVGLFFGRIDYQDLAHRIDKNAAEFVWRASRSLGNEVQVFSGLTGEYGGNYGPPAGFCWDAVHCNDEPVQDDADLEDYNVRTKVNEFVHAALWQASHTRGEHIMFTMGSDFQYEAALEWFMEMDKIIHYVNRLAGHRVNAFYSTPERYMKAKESEAQSVAWPLKTDDFFPYADKAFSFWSGYFTSRPALKRYIRETGAFGRAATQLVTLAGLREAHGNYSAWWDSLQTLTEAMGVTQHHDSVTGTAKQHVTFDYQLRLAKGRATAFQGAVAPALNVMFAGPSGGSERQVAFRFEDCPLRNVSVCLPTQGLANTAFVLYNALAQPRWDVVEIPVSTANGIRAVDTGTGEFVPLQVVPSLASVTNYGAPAGGAPFTALLKPTRPISPLGFRTYNLEFSRQVEDAHLSSFTQIADAIRSEAEPGDGERTEDVIIENEHLALKFCADTGLLCGMKAIDDKGVSGSWQRVEQDFFWYNSSTGNEASQQNSGAYVFRPSAPYQAAPAEPFRVAGRARIEQVVRGDVAGEVHQSFGSWLSQRVRLAKGEAHAELTFTVGPIPAEETNPWGKEVISRVKTDIRNHGESFTDSNGREMQRRQRNYRETWVLNQTESVAGNYFPVATTAFIRDQDVQLTVLTDASQGGSGSVRDGELELMIHRRLFHNDHMGVGEPLNETEFISAYDGLPVGAPNGQHTGPPLVVRGKHFLLLSKPETAARVWRPLLDRVNSNPLFVPMTGSSQAITKALNSLAVSALSAALPSNVQVVTLERFTQDNKLLLRLAHQFGIGEDSLLSKPATVDLSKMFDSSFVSGISEILETSITANQPRRDVVDGRVKWRVEGEDGVSSKQQAHLYGGSLVSLGPLEIKTFIITVSPSLGNVFI